jgi:hypothetical protein
LVTRKKGDREGAKRSQYDSDRSDHVLFSLDFDVIFDFMYFRFRPRAKSIGNALTNWQNAANFLLRFFFLISFVRCVHLGNTKDGTLLSALIY